MKLVDLWNRRKKSTISVFLSGEVAFEILAPNPLRKGFLAKRSDTGAICEIDDAELDTWKEVETWKGIEPQFKGLPMLAYIREDGFVRMFPIDEEPPALAANGLKNRRAPWLDQPDPRNERNS